MKTSSILFLTVILFVSCKQAPTNTKLSGSVFGTSYSVIYDSDVNYQKEIDSLFAVINKSMSTYMTDSDISRLNRNETVSVDNHFLNVFNTSNTIYKATNGAFDPTIGAVVNAWDFGPKGKIVALDSLKIDSLMQGVGFNKVSIKNNTILKPATTFIDFNAIAKGYGVDVIGLFLEQKQIKNYLVEIGGEIRTRGTNVVKQSNWKVGVEMPHFDGEQSILKAISLHNEAMATSGTYRKFKIDDEGNRYSHIIDTKTGYPSKTNLLSISVIAQNCMTADAYATAFKAMGIEKIQEFLKTHPELKVFLIFENDKRELETKGFNGFPE
ncbi:thiamine biosynthesis lipoprotein [Bizionia echini]|uniref:FAD:protein FMN transferase n=1 Tax=Bizionia echini TaxID=649333 RepID=A0A1I5CVL6_9FLAO|nr:FAD:protein FMN transferase [Bizionia echini]SFN91035.1 thiamine biosynthesis lipoprotein [Bizionia echini]